MISISFIFYNDMSPSQAQARKNKSQGLIINIETETNQDQASSSSSMSAADDEWILPTNPGCKRHMWNPVDITILLKISISVYSGPAFRHFSIFITGFKAPID